MVQQIFLLEVRPVGVLEVMVDPLDSVGSRLHPFIVTVVVDVELLRGQQFFDNVLIVLKNIFDKPVRFINQPVGSIAQPLTPKSLLVLKVVSAGG